MLAIALLAACSEAAPTDPLAPTGDEDPLTVVMPDLVPEAGTAGTDRYVPVLQRILHRSVAQIREKLGDEAAGKVVAQAQTLREQLVAAREGGDAAAVREAQAQLDHFAARVGLRVFGPRLLRHVAQDASGKLTTLQTRLDEAVAAGRDVSRIAQGAQAAGRELVASRDAAEAGRLVQALVLAARALDLVTRLHAAL